ncbi:MAG TPA: NAD+ synthase [Candidatus Desulfofervidus auxilii]|uniref:NH(3)-dependent NAD(+) synthetase n=1 Tax=Desulfofervidus auxilii TaxID=1621989 RepID=A0A7C0U2X2_DESA2|nr:NAD+ synthase [Candidatus Desulfofervidus auxilii]
MRQINYDTVIKKIVNFIRRKIKESKVKGVILGISGGVDSATTACLAVKALGKEKVFGLIMPYYKNQEIKDAILVCNNLGIKYKIINIKNIVNEFEKTLDFKIDKITKGNLMVRSRMVILYGIANAKNYLVLGTSNKTEFLVGYFTKWGDGASDIAPLLSLYKTEVRKIAKILEVPEKIISKKPSAGLWKGQTDEDELGIEYDLLDKILYRLIDLKMKRENVAKELGITLNRVLYVENLVKRSKHKRKLPAFPKI